MSKVTFKVGAFCPCKKCCGKNDGISSSRSPGPVSKKIVAAPKKYPFGTKIVLDGYGTYYVEQRGGSNIDNKIEIFFSNHQQVENWEGYKYIKGTAYF